MMNIKTEILKVLKNNTGEVDNWNDAVFEYNFEKVANEIFYVLPKINTDSYWKQRCLLSEKFIEESPCDPDITSTQIHAYENYKTFLKENNEPNS